MTDVIRLFARGMASALLMMALAGVAFGSASCGSTTPDTVPPPVPTITSPANGAVFSNFPRTVTVTWTAVTDTQSNPVTYQLDIHVLLPDGTDIENLTDEGDAGTCNGSVSGTTCTFTFPGLNPGRLRIKAIDKAGNASDFSPFVNFSYTV